MASGTSGAQQSAERKSCPLHIKGDIRFDHVSFAFPDDPETPILKDLDFTVPAGSKLGILGETGAGKSTLVSLISRFYDPTVGHVLIDGASTHATGPLGHLALAGVHRGAGYLPVLRHHRRQHRFWCQR